MVQTWCPFPGQPACVMQGLHGTKLLEWDPTGRWWQCPEPTCRMRYHEVPGGGFD